MDKSSCVHPGGQYCTPIGGQTCKPIDNVSSALAAPGATAPLCTAHASLDALDVSRGVGAVESIPFMDAIVTRFDPYGDVTLAALASRSLDGVRGVEPNFHLGDTADFGARWVDGTWYLVLREAGRRNARIRATASA